MYDRIQELTDEQKTKIHDSSMDLLKNIGIVFNDDEALEIFKKHGLKVEGRTVFFEENHIRKALETVPSRFTVHARNPEKSLAIGEDDFVFAPGYGAPYVITMMESNAKQKWRITIISANSFTHPNLST